MGDRLDAPNASPSLMPPFLLLTPHSRRQRSVSKIEQTRCSPRQNEAHLKGQA